MSEGARDRIFIFATRRGSIGSTGGIFDRFRDGLRHDGRLEEAELDGLTRAELNLFLGSMIGREEFEGSLVARIGEISGGIPRLAEETMALLAVDGLLFRRGGIWQIDLEDSRQIRRPRLVEEALLDHLDDLEPGLREVLAIASVVGNRIDGMLLTRLCRSDPEELAARLAQLVELGYLEQIDEVGRERFEMASPAVRRHLIEEFDEGDRFRLHETIVAYLEEHGRTDTDEQLEAIARHHEAIGNYDRAVDTYVRAGDLARRLQKFDRADGLYHRALNGVEGAGGAREAEVLGRIGSLRNRSGKFEDAIDF
jgi:predicted ATPase